MLEHSIDPIESDRAVEALGRSQAGFVSDWNSIAEPSRHDYAQQDVEAGEAVLVPAWHH